MDRLGISDACSWGGSFLVEACPLVPCCLGGQGREVTAGRPFSGAVGRLHGDQVVAAAVTVCPPLVVPCQGDQGDLVGLPDPPYLGVSSRQGSQQVQGAGEAPWVLGVQQVACLGPLTLGVCGVLQGGLHVA